MLPTQPNDKLLSCAAPLHVWRQAEKQAERSPFHRFRTGAVIFDSDKGKVITRGVSHPSEYLREAIHAEHHALLQYRTIPGQDHTVAVVTLTKGGHYASSSRPCSLCARLLHNKGILNVIYAERRDVWTIQNVLVEDLAKLAQSIPVTRGAKGMQIPCC